MEDGTEVEPTALPLGPDRRVTLALMLALHVLFVALWALALVRSLSLDDDARPFAVVCAALMGLVYAMGAVSRKVRTNPAAAVWVTAISVLWGLLVLHVPDAAYLAFPLFFLYLHVLRPVLGTVAVVVVAIVAIVAIGLQQGWSTGGVAGPTVAAVAALAVAAGYRSLALESRRRRELIDELIATRAELAASERSAGADAERSRLAGEIHDTIAQGLASIQMLLHAVERAAPDHPQIEPIRLARETAGENLREARRVVQALRPAVLEGTSLEGALVQVAEHAPRLGDGNRPAVTVEVRGGEVAKLGVPVASALVRIAQEAVTNAVRHGQARNIAIHVEADATATHLMVSDDGTGFDPAAPLAADSFGLANMRRRMTELGGTLDVASTPDRGAEISARLPGHVQPAASATQPAVGARQLPAPPGRLV